MKPKIINYLSGNGGIAFVEFIEPLTKKVKILSYKNFTKRFLINGELNAAN